MSVTVTQELTQQTVTVTGNPVENNVTVTVSNARGPSGGGSGSVAWDDITGTASDVPFLPVAAPAHSEGLVFYDSTDKSLSYYNDEADVTMNIGREMWLRVRNNSGAAILNGKVVYINDAIGQLPTIRLARADDAITSRVIGIATHDIGNNEFGYVTTTGEIKGLDTNAFDDGDLLFLSAVTAGEMTLTAPLAPNRVIQVATVIHAHPTQGKLYCHPETDSIPSTGIVDSTATGRALITAATPAAARTTLELAAAATAATPNTLVLRDGTGGANFAGTVNMATGVIVDLQFEDYQAGAGATFVYSPGSESAHRTALGSGATGDALFTAATPAAARTTLELGSLATINSPLPVANGGTGTTNGSITGTGALTFTAGGSNQNITITPSGSGVVTISSASAFLNISTSAGAFGGFRLQESGSDRWTFAKSDSTDDLIISRFNTLGVFQNNPFAISTATGVVSMAGTTASTSTTTGALVVSGGAGIAGAVNVGGGATVVGNVGIGTTSPGVKLDILGDASSSNNAYSRLTRGANTSDAFVITKPTGALSAGNPQYSYGIAANTSYFSFQRYDGTTATSDISISTTGNVGIGTASPTALLDVNSNTLRLRTARTPASATAAGNAGDICWDANYIYVCTATNTWKRTAIATW